jgi:hypothetical protein
MMSSSDYFDIFENWGTNTNLTFDWDENQRPLMSASDKRLALSIANYTRDKFGIN